MFEEFDVLEGFDPIDKAELVGKPFGITGVRYRENERKVKFAELEIVLPTGEKLGFQDSSTGVAAQVTQYLADKGYGAQLGEWMDVKLFVPRGLRVSAYDVVDANGKTKQAKTYYLSLEARNGRAPAPAQAPTKAPAKAR
jgi:hypothetical protein